MIQRGCAIAHVVSQERPTALAWVQSHIRLCEICDGQISTGIGFLWVLQFPLPILIPTIPRSLIILPTIPYGLNTDGTVK
jgi:hypothetical protein